jgi:mono/diheme cytochrome c family protein
MRRIFLAAFFVVLILGVLIQAVPYGRHHTNPPVLAEPKWDTPQTRALAARACFDCHSNDTVWPWYSNVAPISWLVQDDVDDGRRAVNFSEWSRPQKEAHELPKIVKKGEMPPWTYSIGASARRLSPAEKQALANGLSATLRSNPATRMARHQKND